MLDHHIQKQIVYALALTPSARFSELKPDGLENKLFDYHLKKVLAAGYVEKAEDGTYALTSRGRRVGKDVVKREDHLIDRAYSVLFLVVHRASDGAWLLCRRKAHPLFDRVGFINTQPRLRDHAGVTASEDLLAKTGLRGDFYVRGSGYLRMYEGDEIESFTHFTMLQCDDAGGELQQLDPLAEYFWVNTPDTTDPAMLPSIAGFVDQLSQPGVFYLESDFVVAP